MCDFSDKSVVIKTGLEDLPQELVVSGTVKKSGGTDGRHEANATKTVLKFKKKTVAEVLAMIGKRKHYWVEIDRIG